MKRSLLIRLMICILIGLSFSMSSNAQSNIASYKLGVAVGSYTPITGGTVFVSGTYTGGQSSVPIPLGGVFTYGGVPINNMYINTNGYLTFEGTTAVNSTIFSASLPGVSGVVAAYANSGANSTVTGSNAEIRYDIIGSELVVQFQDHARSASAGVEQLDFQIRLDALTGIIKLVYGTCVYVNPSGSSNGLVGLRGNGNSFQADINSLMTANVPAGTLCNWSDAVSGASSSSGMIHSANISIPQGLTYTFTPSVTPAPVKAFSSVTGVYSGGASISWTAPSGATQYNIEYRVPGACTWTNYPGNPIMSSTVTLTGLTPTTTYQIRVQSSDGTNTSNWSHIPNANGGNGYTASGTFTTTAPAPGNDSAKNAMLLILGGGCSVAYTNAGATQESNEPVASCSETSSQNKHGVWFKFVSPASGAVRVSTDNTTGTLSDTQIGLFSASDSSNYSTFQVLSCDEDGGVVDGTRSILFGTGLTPGQTYYVLVDGYNGTGTFCVTADVLDSTMISTGNTCVSGYQPPYGSVSTYTGQVPLLDDFGNLIAIARNPSGGAVEDYYFAAHVNSGPVRQEGSIYYLDRNYNINNPTATNVELQLFFRNGEFNALNAASGGLLSLSSLNVTHQAGTTCMANYLISNGQPGVLLQTANGSSIGANWIKLVTPSFSNFYIMPGTNPLAPSCSPPFNITTSTVATTSATIVWTAPSPAPLNGYEYYFGPVGTASPTSATTPTGSVPAGVTTLNLSSLFPSSTYKIWVRSNCGGTNYSSWDSLSFSTLLGNDNASGAVLVSLGAGCSSLYMNTGATQSPNEPTALCSNTSPAGQSAVWFKFVAPPSGAVRVSTSYNQGTLGDTELGLFSASDSSDYATFQIISCDEDGGIGSKSLLYATGLISGQMYYVMVDGWSGDTGTFCLTVDVLDSTMISTTNTCSSGYQTPYGSISSYTGFVPLMDNGGHLVALARNPAGGAVDEYTTAAYVNSTGVRQESGTYYLDRNFRINNSVATNVELQFFFRTSEFDALNAAAGGTITLSNLNVTRQAGISCQSNFSSLNGAGTALMQSANGTSVGANWISITTPSFSNFYLMPGTQPLTPSCMAPNGLVASSIGPYSATVTWSAPNPVPSNGYDYYIANSGSQAPTSSTTPSGTVGPGVTSFSFTGLNQATGYSVWVRGNCGGSGFSQWSNFVSFSTLVVNDSANGAITLTVGSGCAITYSNIGATQLSTEPIASCCQTANTNKHSVWFKFLAPVTGAVRISTDTNVGPGNLANTQLALFSVADSSDYSTFQLLSCDDNNGSMQINKSILYATGLIAGQTYYILVDGNGQTTGSFCITVDELDSTMLSTSATCNNGQAPAGTIATYNGWVSLVDQAGKLIALVRNPAGGQVNQYSVAHNINVGGIRQEGGIYYLDRNYRINNTSATNVEVQFFFLDSEFAALNNAAGGTLTTSSLNITRQAGSSCEADFSTLNGSGSAMLQTGNGAANGVFWVSSIAPSFSNFYIMPGTAPLNTTCFPPTNLAFSSVTSSAATVSWTPPATVPSTGYDYYVALFGSAPPSSTTTPTGTVASTTSSINLTGLSGSLSYTIWVRGNCGPNNFSQWSSVTFSTPIANDTAKDAIALVVNAPCAGFSNSGATNETGEPYASCTVNGGASVWFKFNSPSTGAIRASVSGLFDTQLALFSASDSSNYSTFQVLSCNEDASGAASSVIYAANLVPGAIYYLMVDGYGASTGQFCLAVDELDSTMLSTSNCGSAYLTAYPSGAAGYTGWVPLMDNNERLVALVRNPAGGLPEDYSVAEHINVGPVRSIGSTYYLDRNFNINNPYVTNVQMQLFFLNSEYTALSTAMGGSLTLTNLNATKQVGTACQPDFSAGNGASSILVQDASGTGKGVKWLQFNTPSFSNFYIMPGIYPLQIKLEHLSATNIGARNRVNWGSVSEDQGDYYEVETSIDGVSFATLTKVKGKGRAASYSVWDESPLPGLNFYRLRIVDASGDHYYSPVVSAYVEESSSFVMEAYPNPLQDVLNVVFSVTPEKEGVLTISDAVGKVVTKIPVVKKDIFIDFSHFTPGIYMVQYKDSRRSQTIKVSKQ